MDDEDEFDISDPIDETNPINTIQNDLDDLDDDLFGNALKKKLNAKLSSQSKPSFLSPKHKSAIPDEFDEDDPLAGLLSDDDDDKPKKIQTKKGPSIPVASEAGDTQKTIESKKPDLPNSKFEKKESDIKKNIQTKKKDIFDDDLDVLGSMGLEQASQNKPVGSQKPSTPKKGSSFMSELLGNKSEDKTDKSKTSEFILDDKYKAKPQEKDDYLFGSYNPTASSGDRSTPRRRNVGFDNKAKSKNEDWLSKQDEAMTSAPRRKSGADDWLLKDSSSSTPGSTRRTQPSWLGSDKDSSVQADNKADWLNFGNKKPNQNDDKVTFGRPSDNFEKKDMTEDESDWLRIKQKLEAKQEKPQIIAENINKDFSKQEKVATTIPVSSVIENSNTPIQAPIQQITVPQQQLIVPQIQTDMIEQIGNLQSMVTKLQMEKDNLVQTLENTQKRHQNELKTCESIHREKQLTLEEQFIEKEQRKKEGYMEKINKLEKLVDELKEEKNEFIRNNRDKVEGTETDHKKEIERLKELHQRAITAMKEEHEEALNRLKNLKDQEVEAISSTQSHSKMIQNLVEQLEARTFDLRGLQQTVEERHKGALEERQILIETKEKELRALELRLQRQREEEDIERVRLQQLVMRLEARLQMQTKETEEHRWEFQQEKVKLEIQQKSVAAERRQLEEQLDLERIQLKNSKDSLLREQQRLYTEMAQQKQQLTSERSQFEAQMRQWQQQEAERNSKKLQEEINLTTEKQFLQQEKKQLEIRQQQFEQELKKFHLDRLSLERDQQKLRAERDATENLTLELQKRSKELEDMYKTVMRTKEEGRMAYQKAKEMETQTNNRTSTLTALLETMKMKEREINHQKQALEEERNALQSKKGFLLCAACRLNIGQSFSALYTNPQLPISGKTVRYPDLIRNSSEDPNMLIWQVTAEKDKEFLEVEGSFLQSLTEGVKQDV